MALYKSVSIWRDLRDQMLVLQKQS